jgi:hypothetical protein
MGNGRLQLALMIAVGGHSAAQAEDWPKIERALRAIPSAAGMSVYERMTTCGMFVHHTATWTDATQVNTPTGSTTLTVYFDTPLMTGDPPPLTTNKVAQWVVRDGKATAQDDWADMFQNHPFPILPSVPLNC